MSNYSGSSIMDDDAAAASQPSKVDHAQTIDQLDHALHELSEGFDLVNCSQDERAEFFRKRNALYSQRKYYRKKLRTEKLERERDKLLEKNSSVRTENELLERILGWAEERIKSHTAGGSLQALASNAHSKDRARHDFDLASYPMESLLTNTSRYARFGGLQEQTYLRSLVAQDSRDLSGPANESSSWGPGRPNESPMQPLRSASRTTPVANSLSKLLDQCRAEDHQVVNRDIVAHTGQPVQQPDHAAGRNDAVSKFLEQYRAQNQLANVARTGQAMHPTAGGHNDSSISKYLEQYRAAQGHQSLLHRNIIARTGQTHMHQAATLPSSSVLSRSTASAEYRDMDVYNALARQYHRHDYLDETTSLQSSSISAPLAYARAELELEQWTNDLARRVQEQDTFRLNDGRIDRITQATLERLRALESYNRGRRLCYKDDDKDDCKMPAGGGFL